MKVFSFRFYCGQGPPLDHDFYPIAYSLCKAYTFQQLAHTYQRLGFVKKVTVVGPSCQILS